MSTTLTVLPAPGTQLQLVPGQRQQALSILDALQTRRIDAAGAAGCYAVVLVAIGTFLLDVGHTKTKEEDLERTAKGITNLLLERYGYLGLGEVAVVFRQAALGDYSADGDVLYLSVSNAAGWLKKYRAGQRADVLRSVGRYQPHPLLRFADGPCCHFPDDHPLYLHQTGARLVAHVEHLLTPGVVYDRAAFDRHLYEFCKRVGLFAAFWSSEEYAAVLREETDRIHAQGNPSAGGYVASWDEKGAWKTFDDGYQRDELPEHNRHTQRVLHACRERLLREYLTQEAAADFNFARRVRVAIDEHLRHHLFVPPTGVELP